jgi:hypothetical protein
MALPKYDVAVSFLSADESIAAALNSALSDGLDVFFYPQKQDALAGTNGTESMRQPFLEGSRIVVVLYREPWGKTPWTHIEQAALQDRCLTGFNWLFFMMLDRTSVPPPWVPLTNIRYYADFGLEQAVGAIKARVLESGGTIAPLTAGKHAELARRETQYLEEKRQLRSPVGRDAVERTAAELFTKIKELCAEIDASGSASIEFASDPVKVFGIERNTHECHLRGRVSLVVTLELHPETILVVREFDRKLPMRGEHVAYLNGQPQLVGESRFLPDMNRAREHGWTEDGSASSFLSSESLADNIVKRFVDLSAKADRGELRRSAPRAKRR